MDFIQFLFERYAGFGLTMESDRVVAVAGLVKRMESALDTQCRYGIFELFLPRLLLWRLSDETADNTTNIVDKKQQWPSWSWMTCSQIQFLPATIYLRVPNTSALRFDPEQHQVLLVQMRAFQNCTIEKQGSQHVILDENTKDVGVSWFDTTANTQFQHCVVIGMEEIDDCEDAERTYYILLVSEILDNRYERIGLGKIKARCISKEYCEKRLF